MVMEESFKMKNIIIFGKNGQVATELRLILAQQQEFSFNYYSSKEFDFADLGSLKHKLKNLAPADYIINATAYNEVDKAEEEQERANNINHLAVKLLAEYCKEHNIRLIHYSTNYVFDGEGNKPYKETNNKNLRPLSYYGKTKLLGEQAIEKSKCAYLIFRVATVFNLNKENNFVAKIRKLAASRKELKIVNDQITNPTNSYDIAFNTFEIIKKIEEQSKFKSAIYHLANKNSYSYYELSNKIIAKENLKIIPVVSSEFKTKAARPLNGALDSSKIKKDFAIEITDNYKQLTVIIVTYKSSHIVIDALQHIIKQGYRIIIVDNGSKDNIEDVLDENCKSSNIELIKLKYNIGFGRANNLALEMVNTKYAFLLNPDAIIMPHSLDLMMKIAEQQQNIALLNPIFTNESLIGKNNNNESLEIEKKSYLCGGAMLMNMNIYRNIGFFDSKIFLYGEDDQISALALNNGFENAISKYSFCYHANQHSVATKNVFEDYKLLFFRYWHQGWGKTYLKRQKKNIIKIWLKILHRFALSILYLFKLQPKQAVIRLAIAIGSIANLLGRDCFSKEAKITEIEKVKYF